MQQWEEFTHSPETKIDKIRVSLNAKGHFHLNQRAVDEIGGAEAVVLLFDKKNKRIGLKASAADIENAYELKRQGNAASYELRARGFCNFYGIDIGDTIVFNDLRLEDDVLVLHLDNVTELVRRSRPMEFSGGFREVPRRSHPPKFSTLLRMRELQEE